MKILLFGEYSGFYNTLKEGLEKLNHDTLLVGRSDGFKNYPLDVSFEPSFFKSKLPNLIRQFFYRIFKSDIADLEIFLRFYLNRKKLKYFDSVQLINEFPLQIHPFLEKICLNYIFKHNKAVFLSACGDDTVYINFLLNSNLDYHILTPYERNKSLKPFFKHSLSFLNKKAEQLHQFVFVNIQAVIPADIDYLMAYKNHKKSTPLIPFPVNLSKFSVITPKTNDKIVLFHGINSLNYYKKGNDYFEKALEIIEKKYNDKIEIISVRDSPYSDYIKQYNRCHILLDQVYAYDQGYNALEAMAQGKVVFTGAEKEWREHYNLKEDYVAINALPNEQYLANKLEWLIVNPNKIEEISLNARVFIEKEHNYTLIAQKYLNVWRNN